MSVFTTILVTLLAAPMPIEHPNPEGRGLKAFREALARVERGEGKARVLVYGTSTNGADWVTRRVRQRFAERYGDPGKGLVSIAAGSKWQAHDHVVWKPKGWSKKGMISKKRVPGGYYGLAGIAALADGRPARTRLETVSTGTVGRTVSKLDLFYRSIPNGTDVKISVDGKHHKTIPTAADAPADHVATIEVSEGPHVFDIAVDRGPSLLYGAVLENSKPGVVVDAAMLVGVYAHQLQEWNPDHIAGQIAQRESDLVVFWMGANEAAKKDLPFVPEKFVPMYSGIIQNVIRARPQASCLVMTTMDQGDRKKGGRTKPRVPKMVPAFREVAARTGCAFWNLYESMGGKGTMYRWRRQRPKLVSKDYAHILPKGADRVGDLLFQALSNDYAKHRTRSARP